MAMQQLRQRLAHNRPLIVWSALGLATLLGTLAIALNWIPALRGPDNWRWPYVVPATTTLHLLPVAAVALYVLLAYRWGQSLHESETTASKKVVTYLLFTAVSVPVIQWSLLTIVSADVWEQLYFRAISWSSSGFFSTGSIVDNGVNFLRDYPELMPTFPKHPQRYPPGIPLIFYASRSLLRLFPDLTGQIGHHLRLYQCQDLILMRIPNEILATAVVQMALPAVSGLVLFPLFGLARRTHDLRTAVWAVALYPLVPSFALWAGKWDQLFPLFAVSGWYLLVVGISERRRLWLLAAGLVISLASTLSFGLLFMVVPMGIWTLIWLWNHRDHYALRSIVLDGSLFLLGLIATWGAYQLLVGRTFFEVWDVAMGFHLDNTRYWTWIGYHLVDFGLFLGLPIALLFLFAFFYALLNLRHQHAILPIAFGLSLVTLDISGTARGEVARVWIFLTPFATIAAAWVLATLAPARYPRFLVLALLGMQLVAFNATMRVVSTGLTSVDARSYQFVPPAMQHQSRAKLDERLALLGYDLESRTISAGNNLGLTLYWQTLKPMSTPYTVFNHLVDAKGQVVAQKDNMPVENTLPTTCWIPGEVVADAYQIHVPADTKPGDYLLYSGAYDPLTGERLSASGAGSSQDGSILLGSISIVGP